MSVKIENPAETDSHWLIQSLKITGRGHPNSRELEIYRERVSIIMTMQGMTEDNARELAFKQIYG